MRTRARAAVVAAMMILATTAAAALVFTPARTAYDDPGLATTNIRGNGGQIQVRTADLQGRMAVKASDLLPASGSPATGCAVLPFTQDLTLEMDLAKGIVEGTSRGQIQLDGKAVRFQAAVQGSASCMPWNGAACGQVIVDLDLRGAVADPADAAAVGLLRMQMLGSLVRNNPSAPWAAVSADTSLGLSPPLVSSLLDTMEEGECGV